MGASANYCPVAFCLANQEAKDDCCSEERDELGGCLTDCCIKISAVEISFTAQERKQTKPFPALWETARFSPMLSTPVSFPASRLRSVQDPAYRLTRDQIRAELQVRLN